DPEEDPEEYEDDETEDGPVDYPMDGGDDGDDDDGDSHGDDADDEDEDDEDEEEEDEEEEEEHLAPADSAVVVPTVEFISPPEGTEPVIPQSFTDITTTGARITVRLQASISLPPEAEVERLLAMPTPPPSPLISLSPPSAGEHLTRCTAPSAHSSPPPVPSPLLPSSGCPTQIQTLRIAYTQALVDAVTAALPSPPLPPSLYIPSPVDRRDDILESEQPPRKRSCLFALGPRYEVGESSTARLTRGRGVDLAEAVPEIAHMTLVEDAQEGRTRISQRVTIDSQRVDLLMEDRIAHQETILIVEEEAYASREAWAHAIGLSQAVHSELQTHPNVRNDASVSGPVRGQDIAPVVHGLRKLSVFEISECTKGKKVKFAAATLEGLDLTCWKTKVATMGLDTVNQMPWTEMKQLMTVEFCPIEEVQRMEHELWNLKVKEYDVVAYTQRFNELALMCPRMVEPERVKVDAYIRVLTNNIKGEVTSSKPADLNEAVRMAHNGNGSGKGNQKDNSLQTLQNSQKQGNTRAMVTAPTDGKLPLCERCFTLHVGQCTIKCHKCGKVGHKAKYCKEKSVATGANAQPVWTCYDCGEQGHTRNQCPKKLLHGSSRKFLFKVSRTS
ncbi:putative reverse transcriptase domain-containing protein, partial [Tanacetum coccineum]